jgi:hypothetical protein
MARQDLVTAKVPPQAATLAHRVSEKTGEKLYTIYLRAMIREAAEQGVGDKRPRKPRKVVSPLTT